MKNLFKESKGFVNIIITIGCDTPGILQDEIKVYSIDCTSCVHKSLSRLDSLMFISGIRGYRSRNYRFCNFNFLESLKDEIQNQIKLDNKCRDFISQLQDLKKSNYFNEILELLNR